MFLRNVLTILAAFSFSSGAETSSREDTGCTFIAAKPSCSQAEAFVKDICLQVLGEKRVNAFALDACLQNDSYHKECFESIVSYLLFDSTVKGCVKLAASDEEVVQCFDVMSGHITSSFQVEFCFNQSYIVY